MNEENKDDYVLVFDAPKIEPPEFRLYYEKETGKVLFYSCEKPEGTYIVIDSLTFACARQDIRVVNGKVSTARPEHVINRLVPDKTGTVCLKEDISIVVTTETNLETKNWKLNLYEL